MDSIQGGIQDSLDSIQGGLGTIQGSIKCFVIKHQKFQADAVKAVVDVFAGQPINVMIINSQVFNSRGKDARRIYMKLDEFRSRRLIDIIAKTNPILIIDGPQSVEGKKTRRKWLTESQYGNLCGGSDNRKFRCKTSGKTVQYKHISMYDENELY